MNINKFKNKFISFAINKFKNEHFSLNKIIKKYSWK